MAHPPLGCENKVKTADFAPKSAVFGPSGETRTRGILVPNQAPYQLGHTRILSYEKLLVVVKYVVNQSESQKV